MLTASSAMHDLRDNGTLPSVSVICPAMIVTVTLMERMEYNLKSFECRFSEIPIAASSHDSDDDTMADPRRVFVVCYDIYVVNQLF